MGERAQSKLGASQSEECKPLFRSAAGSVAGQGDAREVANTSAGRLVVASLWALLMASGVPFLPGCSGQQSAVKGDHAASSLEAQTELRELEEEWAVGSSIRRQALRPRLEEFLQTYPSDPSADRARVLMARIAVLEGRLGAAEEMLAPVLEKESRRVRDEATVVLASVRNRQERPGDALALLAPLDGKILTVDSRFEYSREKARACLADRRWRLLVDTITTWIAQSAHRHREAEDWSRKALKQVPAPALSRLLADWNQRRVADGEAEARAFVQREIVEQLSVQALTRKDARLARDLLEYAPSWLRASDVGDELALLAALAEEEAQVSGRVVGMVFGGSQRSQRQRTVMAGVGLQQGLRGSDDDETKGSGVSMIAEEHRGSLRAALAALSGQGAAVLVAAVDPLSAMEALAFAESRRVPVIVLSPPVGLEKLSLKYGFSIGASMSEQRAAMTRGLPTQLAFVGTTDTPCPSGQVRPGATALPVELWREEGVQVVGIAGDALCARRAVLETLALGPSVDFALSLEASSGNLPGLSPKSQYYYVRAGGFPDFEISADQDRYREGEERHSKERAGWFTHLGRDLAALLRVALAELPEAVTSDPEEVQRLHDQARDQLLRAEAQLSTTNARGFGGKHQLPRELSLEASKRMQ